MARTKISEFSATPGNNTDIDGINIAEGCAPSGINDAIRELMSQLKDFQAGTAGDSFNGPVGTTTAAAGAFTTLSASSTVTLSGGTANGVLYLNGSKVATSGSALTFDGSTFKATVSGNSAVTANNVTSELSIQSVGNDGYINMTGTGGTVFRLGSGYTEQMRLTSTGLGIGTSSPENKLTLVKNTTAATENTYGISVQSVNTNGYTELLLGASDAIDAGIIQTAAKNTNFTAKNLALQPQGGNVGIGTSSPDSSFKVTISGNSSAVSPGIYFDDQASSPKDYTLYINGSKNFVLRNQTDTANIWEATPAGNLGLGVTPSAWGTSYKVIQLGASIDSYMVGGSNNFVTGYNFYRDSSDTFRYLYSATATRFAQSGGAFTWSQAASGTAGNAISWTQAMTLTAAGKLAVANTSPGTNLSIGSGATGGYDGGVYLNRGAGVYNFYEASDGTNTVIFGLDHTLSAAKIGSINSYPISFYTGNQERARIDSSGNLLVGTTGQIGNERLSVVGAGTSGYFKTTGTSETVLDLWNTKTSGTIYQVVFRDGASATARGSITTDGTNTAYNTSSDYRLKTLVGAVTSAGDRIDALQPVEFDWKASGKRARGFFADKFQEVYPDSVTGEKDAVDADGNPVYQQMQASTAEVIADLVAELQSLRKRVAQLEKGN